MVLASTLTILIIFTIGETYHPVILKHKAIRKRKETGDPRWIAPIEAKKITFGARAKNILAKPWVVFFREPMLMAITLYMAFVYGCLVCSLFSFPTQLDGMC